MLKTEKLWATAKQLIRNTSICCLKNQEFLSQSEHKDRLDTLVPLFMFVYFLRALHPPPTLITPYNEPFIKKIEKAHRNKEKI